MEQRLRRRNFPQTPRDDGVRDRAVGPDIWATTRLALPLAWEPLDHEPDGALRAQAEQSNAAILGHLLQEIELDATLRAPDEALAAALLPLRAKLDLLVDMVARLSYREVLLPPVRDVELAATRIAWDDEKAPAAEAWIRIALFLHPIIREPIVAFAHPPRVEPVPATRLFRIDADFFDFSERNYSDLARFAFVVQRRRRTQSRLETTGRAAW